MPTTTSSIPTSELVIRLAATDDRAALARLAALDSADALRGTVLVAEIDGEPWAAMSLDDGRAVADPFRPTREVLALLAERGRQLRRRRPRGRMRRGMFPRRPALV